MYYTNMFNPTPGKNFLLVTGILYILFAAMNLISSVMGLSAAEYWDTALPTMNNMPWSVYYTVFILSALFQLFIGIMGISNYTRPDRAHILRWLGVIGIFNVIIRVMFASAVFAGGIVSGFALTYLAGITLPILYISGAHKNLIAHRLMTSQSMSSYM